MAIAQQTQAITTRPLLRGLPGRRFDCAGVFEFPADGSSIIVPNNMRLLLRHRTPRLGHQVD
jgi:hypothetical protein